MNYSLISYILGWVLKIEGCCLALPLICSIIYDEKYKYPYIISIAICLIVGIILTIKKPENKNMYAKEGFVTVALSWIVLSIFGALPFYIMNKAVVLGGGVAFTEGFGYIDALFETASGFTTTGSSILTQVERLPKSLLLWRSFTHWIGGMGILVFLVAIVPLSGGSNIHLIRAESPGPEVNKLVPKIKSYAMILYAIYIGLTFMQIVLMMLCGVSFYDSITTSFSTAGTGGFATTSDAMLAFSPGVQYIITIFMLLFGVDFSIYYLILIRRNLKGIRSDEVLCYFGIIAVATCLIFADISKLGLYSAEETFRHSFSQVAAIITTTGFSIQDYTSWPALSQTIIVFLTFVGACAGSTGGGFKISRVILLFKNAVREGKTMAHPRTVHKITMNGRSISNEVIRSVNVYLLAYIGVFAGALLLISLDGKDFATNFTAVATTINNVGPGLSQVGPMENFAHFSSISKVVLSFVMITGRLEIFPMLVLLSRYTSKK